MCGIVGVYNFNKKKIEERELNSLINALKHRGPDAFAMKINDNIGLAHCRLSIVDLSNNANQPLNNEDNSIWLVCNGEIYNYEELKKELIKKGHQFKTNSDNEIIIHLYEEYGINFVQRIDGMFAFALWDSNKQKLILARDRLGIKPLYYWKKNHKLIFSSEIKGILAHFQFKRDINYDFFRFYFFYNSIPVPYTPFKNITNISPAQLLIFDKNGNLKKIKYWQPEFKVDESINEKSASDKFLALLKRSISHHLPKETDYALAMSGGIDSNMLLALISGLSKRPLKTVSLSFIDDTFDKRNEITIAEKLAKYFNTEHYSFRLSPQDLLEKIESIVEALDAPICTFGIDYFLAEKVHKKTKVLFTGDGIEELLGKYWNHRLARSMAHILGYCDSEKEKNKLTQQFLKRYCQIISQRTFQFPFIYNFLEKDKDSLMTKNKLPLFNKEKVSDYIYKNYFKNYFNKKTDDFLNRILEIDLLHFLPDHSLTVIDRLSMANSVEIRVPYLDHKLVEFLIRIPTRFKMKSGITKYLLRRTAENILPREILYGRHTSVTGPPMRRWLTFHLENYVKSVLSPQRIRRNGLINPSFVRKIIVEHYQLKKYPRYFRNDRMDNLPNDHTIKLWKLILFQIWCEKYLL